MHIQVAKLGQMAERYPSQWYAALYKLLQNDRQKKET